MLIGIGGVSRAGKTKLAKNLQQTLGAENCNIINQDNYPSPQENIPKVRGDTDWEHPDSIDYKSLIKDLQKSLAQFQYTILEGILVFQNPEINAQFDLRIYLKIDKPTFEKRKIEDQRWGLVSKSYREHIWDSHQKYGLIEESHCDHIFDMNTMQLDQVSRQILNSVKIKCYS